MSFIPQDLSLRSSQSAETHQFSPGSDGDLSTSSSTGSLKRRRSYRKKETKDGIDLQKKLKSLELYRKTAFVYKVGDQIDAIKWTDDAKEWYCARVVDIIKNDTEDETLLFVHYEGWPPDQADWISPTLVRPHNKQQPFQYGPKGAEDSTSWKSYADFYESKQGRLARQHTGIVQDRRMSLHSCPCHSRETIHPERPERISAILQTMHAHGLLRYFGRIHAHEVTTQELLRVHTFAHVRNYYPMEDVQDDRLYPPKPLKVTSIAALLNPEVEDEDTFKTTKNGYRQGPMRGVGGGVVIKADQDHIKRQHRRFSSAAAAADASQSNPHPIAPPGLVCKMTCGELGIAVDTTFHPLYSSLSARVSAGALLSLVTPIVQGRMQNGFALIRPPGHHAEDDLAMGFCFYNNVAVAAADTLEKYPHKIKRILIIDWDIHHGNGTQKIFYDNPDVLYISIHRWDHGKFYPFSGAPDECGQGAGLGKNINIAFSSSPDKPKPMGDTEFVAAFYHFVMPIAKQFGPDMIFVSAGFDAAEDHPENLGGYNVSPRGYALMTKMVKDLADQICQGRLILTLEGGYELQPLANACTASVAQLLLPDTVPDLQISNYKHSLNAIKPNQGAVDSFKKIAAIQKEFWDLPDQMLSPNFRFNLPSDWRALDNFSTRPKRDKKPVTTPIVEGY